MRYVEAGFRGFLVTDEANAAGCKLLEQLGANSVNPLADLTVPMLATISRAIKIPMDVYLVLVRLMGGFNRFYEGADIARACAPC